MDKAKAYIRKVGNEYCVFSKNGKNMGCSPTKEGADKRLRQVEMFKHMNKGSQMEYSFNNLAKALQDINPAELGKNPESRPSEIKLNPIENKVSGGTLASRRSAKILDSKEHFPVITQCQAQSSMTRVLQLIDVPTWYNGTLAELRQEVYSGILSLHPNIQFNVRVSAEQAIALSDGQTTPDLSSQSIKNPADVVETKVPQVPKTKITSAQVEEALQNEELRKVISGRLMEMIDHNMQQLTNAKNVANRLLSSGIKADEFEQLSSNVQETILRELMMRGTTASLDDRRRELINRLSK